MSKTVYLDTNVFDHIQKRHGVSEADYQALKEAVKDTKISVVASFLNIEEVMFTINAFPPKGRAQLQLILELADFNKFVRSQDEIIGDAICSYALGNPKSNPFTVCNRSTRRALASNARRRTPSPDVRRIVKDARAAKEKFKTFLAESKDKLAPLAKQIKGGNYRFPKYLEDNKGWMAEGLAERAGLLEECRQRSIDGLLKVKPVSLAAAAPLSLAYSHDFEGRAPKSGDSRDLLHAVLASSADFFVTHDKEFARVLKRVPVQNFKVVDLHDLLKTADC